MAQKSDFELIGEFRSGNEQAFNELVLRYQEKVYWVARRIVGSHADADDAVQDVFLRVYGGLKSFRSESGFYTWLYRIAMNVSLSALRKKRVKEFLHLDDLVESYDGGTEQADAPVLHAEYLAALERAVDRLPPKQKAVFMMRYYDELPYEEMAAILRKSVGGVKANYSIALRKIMEYVRKELHS